MSVSRIGSILVNTSAALIVCPDAAAAAAATAAAAPQTQLVLVSLLDDEVEEAEAADDDVLEHPVLFIHNVCRLNLPSSYGNDVAVVVTVLPDFSLAPDSLRRVPVLVFAPFERRPNSSLDRLVLNAHTSNPTISTTETAPMNEPSSVCFNSDVVSTNDADRSELTDCCCCCCWSNRVLNSGINL